VHRLAADASHETLMGDPVYPAATSAAILEVVESVCTGTSLSR
jgi:hypothetical protein